MLHDLVSPWAAAVASTSAQSGFRDKHATLLESLRLQRAPHSDRFPLLENNTTLQRHAARAADAERQHALRQLLVRAAALGADAHAAIVLLAGTHAGDLVEPIPYPASVVLFLDAAPNDRDLTLGFARGIAALTRWTAPDSRSPLRAFVGAQWDRWRTVAEIPLREWLYGEGLGIHLAAALDPSLEPHHLVGTSPGGYRRLRERERVYRSLLDADLDHRGLGVVLRWLGRPAPASVRTLGDTTIPAAAGPYLAWRLVAERVERVGLREAIRMEA